MTSPAGRGYNTLGDVLTKTADGRDLNELWTEFQQVVAIYNERRNTLISLLTFPVTQVIEDVPQITTTDFEEATEFGVPVSMRNGLSAFQMAYDFRWYDLRKSYTWMFLAEANTNQVEALHQQALEADNRLQFNKVMNTLFRPTNRAATIQGQNYTVFSFYNADGTIPPPYGPNTFDGTHTHFRKSNAALVDSQDLESAIDDLRLHGYSPQTGTQIIILCNNTEANEIRRFRMNQTNNNAAVALYDFIPAQGQPGLIVPNAVGLIGTQPPSSFQGLPVVGSYADALIVVEDYIPPGYMAFLASGGDSNLNNAIGFREHQNADLRGLRLIPGDSQSYPLIDGYYIRGFGTGIRQRGAGLILQIGVGTVYAAPTQYLNG